MLIIPTSSLQRDSKEISMVIHTLVRRYWEITYIPLQLQMLLRSASLEIIRWHASQSIPSSAKLPVDTDKLIDVLGESFQAQYS